MANPLSYTAVPTSSPFEDEARTASDQPWDSHAPPYPVEPSGSFSTVVEPEPSDKTTASVATSHRPLLPPLESTPESQIKFYRDELSFVRQENQRLQGEIEAIRKAEVERLKSELSNTDIAKNALLFFGAIIMFVLIMSSVSR